jgi:hypothetical protein
MTHLWGRLQSAAGFSPPPRSRQNPGPRPPAPFFGSPDPESGPPKHRPRPCVPRPLALYPCLTRTGPRPPFSAPRPFIRASSGLAPGPLFDRTPARAKRPHPTPRPQQNPGPRPPAPGPLLTEARP